ncbi:hypothetical protein EVAR_39227_1 [Eumeta japonica]|uniref:HAT C-terminal dimerisation domain-containing protein n=1 Tax=Eumeta variegata TaxID=151549 RepID=A0A4C1VLL7_EUMVA|nr:hypothetical protein EVAR_39227_1 [Eumeta japonica]
MPKLPKNHCLQRTQEESESEASTSSGVTAPKKSRHGYESMQQQKLNFKTPPIQSLGEILARLAAKDGSIINAITKSEFICDSLSAKGYKLPMCVNDVMDLILKYYEDKENEMIKELSDICSSGNWLSKLQLLGMPNDDEHSSSDETSSTDDDDESYMSNEESRPQIIDDINNVMTETRLIIRFFIKSPLKSITLQKHVVAEFGVELVLLLDVRTRCNSMLTMIKRFLKLKNEIKKALIDLDSSQKWDEDNITVLQKLQMILTPTKLAVEALSRQDVNLFTTEAIIDVSLKKLESINDPLALKLVDSLKLKISECLNTSLISPLNYLNSPDNFMHNKSNYFIDNNKAFLIGYAERQYNCLYPAIETLTKNESVVVEEVSPSEPGPESFEIQLEKALKGISTNEEASTVALSKSIVKKEFLLFVQNGKRSPNIESMYKALLSVKPTSTENERVFSISVNIVNKIRNRLSDKAINALVFLKAYFIRQSKLT